jgi:AcrR family transcriptional regulator
METDVMAVGVAAGKDPSTNDSAKRRQIMDGAWTVFMSDGFDGASMNEIARAAGVSKGTLYVYFDSKEQLFEALIREFRTQQAERVCIFPQDARDLGELLHGFGYRLVEMMTRPDNLAHLRVVIAAAGKFPRLGQAFYEAGPCHGIRKLAEKLRDYVAAGALEITDVERAAQQFLDLCKSGVFNPVLFRVVETVSSEDIEKSVKSAVEVFLRAYASPRASAEPV